MNPEENLKLLHIVAVPFLCLALLMMHPRHAERSYHRNIKWAGVFLPGRWKEKEFFVRWTRRLARLWFLVLLLVYFTLLFVFLNQKQAF